ncbi:MAG: CRISPR-associated protein Cas4 [Phormidesmis sp. RL_2_1]|nr:CRISPR-associated protein Cas4 [Phormidesmis sp. RL_2_1]
MSETYLPLSYLNAWEYCHRRFYLEYALGEMELNEHIVTGTHLHRNVNEETVRYEGETTIYQQQWVWSDRLQISGIIDAVEETHGQLVPLEYKKGRMGKHLSDHFQLCGAALCLEERTRREIPYGEIFYHGNRRREQVPFTETLRAKTETAIAAAQAAIQQPIPPPITHKNKCQACSLSNICLPKETLTLRQ